MTLTVGSLFAGIGGLELGLEMTGGFRTKWQVELDPYATGVLERHWPDVRRWRDITTFPPDSEDWRVDVITAGFPCQDISQAGRGDGLQGARSGLFFEAARVVGLLRPRYVVLENVAAILYRGMGVVLSELAALGLDAEWNSIPAGALGAPHIRDRVFIIAYPQVRPDTEVRGRRVLRRTPGTDRQPDGVCETLSDSSQPRLPVPEQADLQSAWWRDQRRAIAEHGWWSAEPDVDRVAHGVSRRVDRLKCLGNAVVPQVAQWIGYRILEIEGES